MRKTTRGGDSKPSLFRTSKGNSDYEKNLIPLSIIYFFFTSLHSLLRALLMKSFYF